MGNSNNLLHQPEIHRLVVDWAIVGSIVMFLFIAIVLIALVLAIYATFVSAETFPASYGPFWIFICWVLPIIGPLAALKAAKKFKRDELKQGS